MELPEEDAEEGMCATDAQAIYGTRDAAQTWECTYLRAHAQFEAFLVFVLDVH